MRVIIAGCRNWNDQTAINVAMAEYFPNCTKVISGGCDGADYQGECWAQERNIPIERFMADWDKLGKIAGPIRNKQMANNADALLACWDGKSRGTKNMIDEARRLKLPVRIIYRQL